MQVASCCPASLTKGDINPVHVCELEGKLSAAQRERGCPETAVVPDVSSSADSSTTTAFQLEKVTLALEGH